MAAMQALRRTFTGFHRRLAAATGTISHADAFVLHHIAHDGPVTAGEVADFTGLTTGGVTNVLDRLEQAGFVRRTRRQDDRRVVLVALRPGVHAAIAGTMDNLHADVAAMFGDWDLHNIETLARLLDRLHLAATPPRHAAGKS
jgi:DNA-binding MarR family transcriptional regulator